MTYKEITRGTKVRILDFPTGAFTNREGVIVDINYTWPCPYKIDLGDTSHRQPVRMIVNFKEEEFEVIEG